MDRVDFKTGTFYLGNCFEIFPFVGDPGSVDMVLCDLPYGTTQNKWDSVLPLNKLWGWYWHLLKANGPAVLTAAQPFTSALVMSQAELFRYEWIWVKSKITGVLNAKRMPVRKHEQVLIFYEDQPTYNAQGLVKKGTVTKQGGNSDNYGDRPSVEYVQEWTNWPRDVLEIASEGLTVHPTQKPVALFEYLIRTYTNPNELVLDNTAGSGTTAVAAIQSGRRWICIEKDPDYFARAIARVWEAEAAL